MTISLRERRRQLLYDEILTAVGEMLGEKGYSAMSMDELAARVGISKPTLYSIFPTKEDLLVETVVHGMDRVTAVIQADQIQRSPLQRLLFILRTVIQMQVSKGALTPRSKIVTSVSVTVLALGAPIPPRYGRCSAFKIA